MPKSVERPGLYESFQRLFVEIAILHAVEEIRERREWAILLSLLNDGRSDALAEVFDGNESKTDAVRASCGRAVVVRLAFNRLAFDNCELAEAFIDIRRKDRYLHSLALGDDFGNLFDVT